MADYYYLVGPQGSVFNLGSWIQADPGPDFGDGAMRAAFTENPAADGGQLSAEMIGVRNMSFPLILGSNAAWTSLPALEGMLRLAARPGGAYIDLQPNGVATADMIRFDIITGRWKPGYQIRHQAIGRRLGTLELDTQPFGYMPTSIILASAASVGLPGSLAVPGASVLGDVPGLAKVRVAPFEPGPTQYAAGTWRPDAVFFSLSGRPSFLAHLRGASLAADSTVTPSNMPTVLGDQFAPASQAYQVLPSAGAGWEMEALYGISGTALEPAYRGRHRAFVWARLLPSQIPWYLSVDVVSGANPKRALASAAPVATIPPGTASGTPGGYGAQPSPAYALLDVGEITIPDTASGIPSRISAQSLRLWVSAPTTNMGIATPLIRFGGIYLVPLEGGAGLLPRGLTLPTIGAHPTTLDAGRGLVVDSVGGYSFFSRLDVPEIDDPIGDSGAYYRGVLPLVGASTLTINVCGGARKLGASTSEPLIRAADHRAAVSVTYRPRFAFVRGL